MNAMTVTPDSLAASERAIIGSLLDPTVTLAAIDRDAPTVRRLLAGAPESWEDVRLGTIAAAIRDRLAAGRGVTADLVTAELAPDLVTLLFEAGRDGLPLTVAEREAETVWAAYEHRQARDRVAAEAMRVGLRTVEAEPMPRSPLEAGLQAEAAGVGGSAADNEALARLAALPPVDYDRCREAEAKRLGVRVPTLDAEVARRRAKADGDAALQGHALHLPEPEPWPDPVDGAETLNEVAGRCASYVALPDGAADICALWAAHTHCLDIFICSPRLHVTSPEKGCGKTTLRDVIALFVPRPLPTENLTVAVLFRVIEGCRPTLLADECDAWLRDNEGLRGLLNAGHRRGGQALRCEGDEHKLRAFHVFAPTVLCGIGSLPGTLHDRSIVIRLARAKPGEVTTRFDSRHVTAEMELSRKLARWCAENRGRLAACDPAMPPGAFNRIADNWRPLFAVAEVVGGDWPHRAAEAFSLLTAHEDLDAQGIGTMLLGDIAAVFAATGADRLPSKELAERLAAIEGRPWAEWGRAHRPITPNQLAIQLRRFGVAPRTIKLGDGTTAKGYHRKAFDEVLARYLAAPPHSDRNPVTMPINIGDSAVSEPSPPETRLRSETAVSANKIKAGDGVTVREPHAQEMLL